MVPAMFCYCLVKQWNSMPFPQTVYRDLFLLCWTYIYEFITSFFFIFLHYTIAEREKKYTNHGRKKLDPPPTRKRKKPNRIKARNYEKSKNKKILRKRKKRPTSTNIVVSHALLSNVRHGHFETEKKVNIWQRILCTQQSLTCDCSISTRNK